uniref:Major facilitator superfamily (MFS) profile domain-containing protein n=1 Tax=Oryza punctata TaxID=4537 RepID=A0A0E0MHH5_ORYPU
MFGVVSVLDHCVLTGSQRRTMARGGDDAADVAAPLLAATHGEPRRNTFAFGCATLASMTTILMGYNLALMSGAELFIREDLGLADEQVEVLSGSMNVFMLASILAAGSVADAVGRRGTLVLANALLMAGALAMSLGGSYAALMAARFVTSVGVGFAVVVAPVYAVEISPASSRGVLSSLPEIFINAGILLSYVSNYALAGLPLHLGWRVMFAAGVVPPVFLSAGVLAMPESPRWLAMRGRDAEARAVLARTSDTPAEADLRLEEITHAVAAQADVSAGVWRQLLVRPTPTVRRIITNVLSLHFFQQASGIDVIVLYSPLVFKQAGMASNTSVLAATVAVGVVKTCFILVATLFSDRAGRRPLLLSSAAGIAVTLTSLALTLCVGAPSTARAAACVASALAYVAAFSVGLGPLATSYGNEIMPLRLRAQGASLGVAVNRVTCGVLSMTFISVAGGITMAGCFFLYAGAAVAAWVFVYVRLPETSGRSLEDMDSFTEKPKPRSPWRTTAMPRRHSSPRRPSPATSPAATYLALMSGAQLFIREDIGLTDAQIEVLAGSMNVYMLVSILAAGWAADVLGRRGTLVLANAFLMAGALAMSLGASYAALMAARFVTSIGVGFSLVVAPVYNAEISPASARGVLSSLLDMFVNVGILLSYVSNYALAGLPVHVGWRVMYGIGVLPPVFLAAGVLAMPESPRWLAMRGRHADARAVLVRTSDSVEEAELRLEEIKQAVEAPQEAGVGVWQELLLRPSAMVRRIVTCVVGLHFFQQASGIDAIVLYSPLVFKKAGMASNTAVLGATVGVGVVKTCFILVATLFSDRLGRRPLLLASTGGVAVTLTSMALTLCVASPSTASAAACVASVMAFVAAFSVGFGPMTATYTAEIMPLRLRAQGASLGMAVNRLTCGVVSMTFISLADGITMPGCFFLYAGVAAVACVFVYVRLPETRGRSLEDMDVLFAK